MAFTSHIFNEETRFWFIDQSMSLKGAKVSLMITEHFITLNFTQDTANFKAYG